MRLSALREQWEKGLKVVHTHCIRDALYVLLNNGDNYHLHRYFAIGDNWNISVDHRGDAASMMREILTMVSC